MSKTAPRRALPQSRAESRRGPLLIAGAAISTLAVAGTVFALSQPRLSPQGDARRGCPEQAQVLADPAWAETITAAGEAWGTSLSPGCRPITVTPQRSAVVARDGLGEHDGWFPEDALTVQGAAEPELRTAQTTQLGTSPLVVVTQRSAGSAVPGGIQGETLRQMITLDKSWADFGHEEWGHLKLVLPDPETSIAGAAAFASLINQTGRGAPMPTDLVKATPDQLNMARVEQRLVARPELSDVIRQLPADPADENGLTPAGPRTGVTTLTKALQTDTPLAASFLDSHTGLSLVMANPAEHKTLTRFAEWLTEEEGAAVLAQQGVNTPVTAPQAKRLVALGLPNRAPAVQPNVPDQLEQARSALAAMQRRTSALLVLDTSGSMAEPLGPGGPSRIEAVVGLAIGTWNAWPPGMANGLITFNATNDAAMTPQVREVIPLQRDNTKSWLKDRPNYQQQLKRLPQQVSGGTPLYQAITHAWRYNVEHYQNGLVNRIIVVTDGRDEDAASTVGYEQMMQALPDKPDPARPIKVTYVALGPDADYATLQKIAKATNQKAMQVKSVDELQTKLTELMVS
ncbi:VWA domain-containing protein [Luteococcus sp. OSA5]|uniref:VWA domain-containing protein n=1 Tax=Luteococcus sp. OSA5 TaxID=3401630 RepID=UPI003B4284DA